MIKKATHFARQSPDRAAQGLLYGWVGKTMIPGRGKPRRARAQVLVRELLDQARPFTIRTMVDGIARTLGVDPSAVAGSLTTYDTTAGQYTTVPDRFSIPALLTSVHKATEDDAQAVRSVVLWVIVWCWNLLSELQKPHPPTGQEAPAFAYSLAPLALALLLHVKAILPPADWQTFSANLSIILRPYMSVDGEVMVREYPFRKATQRKGRAKTKRST
jgi:hypothetical protein